MKQPLGLLLGGKYGKEALFKTISQAWFGKLNEVVVVGQQYKVSDHSVLYKQAYIWCILLVLYVDDVMTASSDSEMINALKSLLRIKFHTKDLGTPYSQVLF